MRYQIGICNQHAWRVFVRTENPHRLSRLHQQRFVGLEVLQTCDYLVEIFPGAGSTANPAINHKGMRILGNIRVQIIH